MATKTVTITVSDVTGAEVEGEPWKVLVTGPNGKEAGPYDVSEHEAAILTSGKASITYKRGGPRKKKEATQ